jgi:hypothetical protein
MNHHQQNKNERSSKTLSTWSLSLVMMGMCAGQLMAADVPPPVKVPSSIKAEAKKAITSDEFNTMDDINKGKRGDPVIVARKNGDWKFTVVSDVKEKISELTWFSMDVVEADGEGQRKEAYYNLKKHNFDISFLSEEEQKSLREGEKDLIKRFLGDKESESVVIFTENLVLNFLEVTIDFKGGGESQFLAETARVIEDAYLRQIPSQIKGFLPDRLRIEVTENESKPRFGALKFSNATLNEIKLEKSNFSPNSTEGLLFNFSMKPPTYGHDDAVVNMFDLKIGITSPEFATEFFNVGDMPRMRSTGNNISAPNVAALFELAWTMNANVVWANTKFHPETGMLIVKGRKSEIEIAKTAFNTLSGIFTAPNTLDQISKNLDRLIEIQSGIQSHGSKGDGKGGKEDKESKGGKESIEK